MITIEKSTQLSIPSGQEFELRVERTDISFQNTAGDKVRIQVTVHNAGTDRSPAMPMRLESAPLGAFVPWRPLACLLVPALDAGESGDVSIEVARPRPTPLGDFNRVPPRRLLAAVNSADESSRARGTRLATMFNLLRRAKMGAASVSDLSGTAELAPDLWDLQGRSQPHWAGNINVFVGTQAVERHLAKALRVYPGRTNLAMFMVGGRGPGKHDAYAFELVGLAADWKATLYDVTSNRELDSLDVPTEETEWVETAGGLVMMVAIQPPIDCESGSLEVHVKRRSAGETAIVEFDLDPSAQGKGCYFV